MTTSTVSVARTVTAPSFTLPAAVPAEGMHTVRSIVRACSHAAHAIVTAMSVAARNLNIANDPKPTQGSYTAKRATVLPFGTGLSGSQWYEPLEAPVT